MSHILKLRVVTNEELPQKHGAEGLGISVSWRERGHLRDLNPRERTAERQMENRSPEIQGRIFDRLGTS